MARASRKRSTPENPEAGLTSLSMAGEPTGLALDQLSVAFAGMLSTGDDPYSAAPASPLESDEEQSLSDPASTGSCDVTPRSILEAMLFVGSPTVESPAAGSSAGILAAGSLSSRHVAGLMRGVRPAEIDALVRELNADYQRRNCPYTIAEVAGGYRLVLREEYDRLRDKYYGRTRQARLSQAAIEVLAAVAYNEPVSAEDVGKMRGTESSHVLSQLVRRQLVRLERSDDKPRRPRYWTTPRFLELFGLKSLAELPRSQDLDQPPAAN